MRLHVARFEGGGELAVFGADGERLAAYRDAIQDRWTPLGLGEVVSLEFRPSAESSHLPFSIDLAAAGAEDLLPRSKGCVEGDLGCQDQSWKAAQRAAVVMQAEGDGESLVCHGWLINTRSGSRVPYVVTASGCFQGAKGLTALFGDRQQRAGSVIADRDDAALVQLESAPDGAYFLGWNAENETDRQVTLSAYSAIEGAQPQEGGAAVLSEPGIASAMYARGDALVPFERIYAALKPYLEDTAACEFQWSGAASSFSAAGGPVAVDVKSKPGCAWSAISQSDWIRLDSDAFQGSARTLFRLAPNPNRAARSGQLTIAGRTFRLTQDGAGSSVCETQPVEIGSPIYTEVAPECRSSLEPGRVSRRFSFHGEKGQPVTLAAESPRLEPSLYLLDQGGEILAKNRNGGETAGARIPAVTGTYKLPYTGQYVMEVVTASDSGTLRLAACPGVTPITIAYGQTLQGSLTSNSCVNVSYYTQLYQFQGTAGQQVAVTMTSSTLDSFLVLNGTDGLPLVEDDDSGGSLNSRIPSAGYYTLPQTGTYIIEASHWDPPLQTGAFSLNLALNGGGGGGGGGGGTGGTPLKFVAVTPCRVMDTRAGSGFSGLFGAPSLTGAGSRDVPIPSSACGIPSSAQAYSLNVTVVPMQPLSFLTVWPAGVARPNASTLNSFDGRVVANAAIVPAGSSGAVSVYATDLTDVIIDINGYFLP